MRPNETQNLHLELLERMRAQIEKHEVEIAIIKLKIAFVSGICGVAGSALTLLVNHFWK